MCFFLSVCPSRRSLTQPQYCESTQGHESSALNTARVKVHEKICVLSECKCSHTYTHMLPCCCNAYGAYFKVYLRGTTMWKYKHPSLMQSAVIKLKKDHFHPWSMCRCPIVQPTQTTTELTYFKITAGVDKNIKNVQQCVLNMSVTCSNLDAFMMSCNMMQDSQRAAMTCKERVMW